LKKKVTLIQHFKAFFDQGKSEVPKNVQKGRPETLVYLRKWLKTKHALIFRLNNKLV
jgi:polo-like kinase 1